MAEFMGEPANPQSAEKVFQILDEFIDMFKRARENSKKKKARQARAIARRRGGRGVGKSCKGSPSKVKVSGTLQDFRNQWEFWSGDNVTPVTSFL